MSLLQLAAICGPLLMDVKRTDTAALVLSAAAAAAAVAGCAQQPGAQVPLSPSGAGRRRGHRRQLPGLLLPVTSSEVRWIYRCGQTFCRACRPPCCVVMNLALRDRVLRRAPLVLQDHAATSVSADCAFGAHAAVSNELFEVLRRAVCQQHCKHAAGSVRSVQATVCSFPSDCMLA